MGRTYYKGVDPRQCDDASHVGCTGAGRISGSSALSTFYSHDCPIIHVAFKFYCITLGVSDSGPFVTSSSQASMDAVTIGSCRYHSGDD